MGITDPAEAGAEPVVVERHEDLAAIGEPTEEAFELVVVIALDPQRYGRGEAPRMIDRTVGAAEVATREAELRDLDRALGSDFPGAVALDLR